MVRGLLNLSPATIRRRRKPSRVGLGPIAGDRAIDSLYPPKIQNIYISERQESASSSNAS